MPQPRALRFEGKFLCQPRVSCHSTSTGSAFLVKLRDPRPQADLPGPIRFGQPPLFPSSRFARRYRGVTHGAVYGRQRLLSITICLGNRGGKVLVHLPKETTRRSSGRVWRKVPDNVLSYLDVGLHLSARRLPPPLLRPCFVALSSDFVEGTFIPFPESTA